MKYSALLLHLSAAASALALEPVGINLLLDTQPDLNPCTVPQTTTTAYTPASTQTNGQCADGSWKVRDFACCPDGFAAKTVGEKGAACCPCGAFCTGYLPPLKTGNAKREISPEPTGPPTLHFET